MEDALSQRIIVPVSAKMLQDITDYRFERRIESKSEAVRRLIAAGLKAEMAAKSKSD